MTIVLTVFSGVLIYVLGQIIMKIVIEPIQELKRELRELYEEMVYYSNIYSNPDIESNEFKIELRKVSNILRKKASVIISYSSVIPWYTHLSKTRIVPDLNSLEEIKKSLIGLSNIILTTQNVKHEDISNLSDKIMKYLKKSKVN